MSIKPEHSAPKLPPEQGSEVQWSDIQWRALLSSELAAAEQPAASIAASVAQAVALSAALEREALPRSLAGALSRQIAAQAQAEQVQVKQVQVKVEPLTASLTPTDVAVGLTDAQVAALLQLPPDHPPSQAQALARAIAHEARAVSQRPHGVRPGVSSVLAGVNAALAVGGLSVLGSSVLGSGVLGGSALAQPPAFAGMALYAPAGKALDATSLSLAALLGLGLLLAASTLLVWRPRARKLAGALLVGAALLSAPTVWNALPASQGLHALLSHALLPSVQPWSGLMLAGLLLAGLLLQMGLLLLGGQARTLTSRQEAFPWQALGTGLLTILGLLGLGVLLLALGLPWAMPVLVGVLLLAAVVGLGVSLLSLGRGVRVALPGTPRWVAALASLGIYGTSLAMPPLAALLLLLGGAWGLGSVLLPQRPTYPEQAGGQA